MLLRALLSRPLLLGFVLAPLAIALVLLVHWLGVGCRHDSIERTVLARRRAHTRNSLPALAGRFLIDATINLSPSATLWLSLKQVRNDLLIKSEI